MVSANVKSEIFDEQQSIFDCTLCDQSFDDAKKHVGHISRVHFICSLETCQHKFRSRDLLARHWVITQHRYYCHVCDLSFSTAGRLERHTCKPKSVVCQVCKMIAPDERSFELHWHQVQHDPSHKAEKSEFSPDYTTCESCSLRFTSATILKEHLDEEFGCSLCYQHHEDADQLARHKRTHKDQGCIACDTKFHTFSDMLHHVEGSHCDLGTIEQIQWAIMEMEASRSPMLPKAWGYYQRHRTFKPGQKLYYCRSCPEREFPNLAGLFAHVENSGSCQASITDSYIHDIIKTVYGEEIY